MKAMKSILWATCGFTPLIEASLGSITLSGKYISTQLPTYTVLLIFNIMLLSFLAALTITEYLLAILVLNI